MMAPEILSGSKYDHSADVWSLGCVFYEMLTGYPPFSGISQVNLIENIIQGVYYFPKTLKLSLQALSFLNACLQFDHTKRPSLVELIKHPYISMDENPAVDDENELFLSFYPVDRIFKPEKPFNGAAACNGLSNEITH